MAGPRSFLSTGPTRRSGLPRPLVDAALGEMGMGAGSAAQGETWGVAERWL